MPEISASVAYLGGSISRLSDSRFYAVIPGKRGCLTSYKTTQPDCAFRQAYNYLRRDAGLPKFPRLCSCCGQRPTWKQSHKCVVCSRPKRNAAELAQNGASGCGIGNIDAKREIEPVAALKAPVSKTDEATLSARRFRDALAKCDALIRARGGSVKPGYQRDDWQQRAAKRSRRERMLTR
jgi:hypothetical protein